MGTAIKYSQYFQKIEATMSDWDNSDDDDWDNSDDDLDERLGLTNTKKEEKKAPVFDDEEEDLAIIEKNKKAKEQNAMLKTKGNALAEKKRLEQERKQEEEIARKAMEMELERESKMTPEERRLLAKEREEAAAEQQIGDLFGGVDVQRKPVSDSKNEDKIVLKDYKDYLKHARNTATAMKNHGKIHLTAAFFKECIQQSKDVLDDDAVSDLIKTLNVIKNEKVAAAKKKVKGQAQKAKKDKAAEAKAKKIHEETFGDSNIYDQYDDYADQYEDDFF